VTALDVITDKDGVSDVGNRQIWKLMADEVQLLPSGTIVPPAEQLVLTCNRAACRFPHYLWSQRRWATQHLQPTALFTIGLNFERVTSFM
jgi:hypothetical protein